MSEKYRLLILPEAQQDLRNIIIYIAKNLAAPQAALSLQENIEKQIKTLEFNPQRVKPIDESPWKESGIRKTRVKNYYIYFIVDDKEMAVKITAVIYAGRDQTTQLSERDTDKDQQ